jgi:hypothetical protein
LLKNSQEYATRNNCGWYQQDVAVTMSTPPGCDIDGSLLPEHLKLLFIGTHTEHGDLKIWVGNHVSKVLGKIIMWYC